MRKKPLLLENYERFFGSLTESKLTEQKYKPKELIGKRAKDDDGREGTIIAATTLEDWQALKMHDSSNWLGSTDMNDLYDYGDPTLPLVAFEGDDGKIEVYPFAVGDFARVDLIDEVNEVGDENDYADDEHTTARNQSSEFDMYYNPDDNSVVILKDGAEYIAANLDAAQPNVAPNIMELIKDISEFIWEHGEME